MTEIEVTRSGQPGTDLARPDDVAAIMKHLPIFDPGLGGEELSLQRKKLETLATTPEDQRVLAAYKALEEGRQLVSLSVAIASGGLRSDRMPQLAVTRADLKEVRVRSEQNGSLRFSDPIPQREGWGERKRKKLNAWSLTFPRIMESWAADYSVRADAPPRGGTCRAPYIPPTVRPANPENYLVFWEAGSDWTTDPVPVPRPRVVIDPAILEHVVGDLYMVVATWDLTPIESAALDG